ncbi:hypothetical protein SLA2020_283980 [Shorea laevis]
MTSDSVAVLQGGQGTGREEAATSVATIVSLPPTYAMAAVNALASEVARSQALEREAGASALNRVLSTGVLIARRACFY